VSAEKQQAELIPVDQAVALARAGDPAAARAALVARLGQQPADADAWFWLACITTSPWEAWSSLQKALELNPRYPGVAAGLEWIQGEIAAGRCLQPLAAPYTPAEAPPATVAARPWLLTLAGAIVGFLLFGGLAAGIWFGVLAPRSTAHSQAPAASSAAPRPPTRPPTLTPATNSWEEAWNKGDWISAVALLEQLSAKEPTNSVWRSRLFEAHVRLGNYYADRNQVKEALTEYDRAVALRPYDTELQQARGAASRYLTALERYQAGDWPAAVEALQAVYNQEGAYRDTRDLLYSAHYNLALAYEAAGRLEEAERELLAARPFARNALDLEQKIAQVKVLKPPATPTPSPKRIEVDISEQRFYAYEGDKAVYKFICSTGNNASPTAPGSYHILDKIPMAYASTWNLQMPYWMGIYWSGTLENGIHALPILSNGNLLWDGFLGQRVSFGCVILSTQDAKTIYDWADVGTSVAIRQ
jgi:lipoprotein-anchoring transpeptidase ErfK/SrfK